MPKPHIAAALIAAVATAGVLAGFAFLTQSPAPRPVTPARSAFAAQPAPVAPAPETPADYRFGVREPIARRSGTIRVATYNIENLFDDKDDPALSGRYEDRDETKPEEHLAAAAEAIRRIDADVVCLQEVESAEALAWFMEAYLKDAGYAHVASVDAGDERGIEQAGISRLPIKDVKNWPGEALGGVHPEHWGQGVNYNAGKPITFHRSPLRVTVEAPVAGGGSGEAEGNPYELTLFVVHQKSGRDGEYWRVKEAAKTVELVRAFEAERPTANIVVLGDFNALPGADSFKQYAAGGLIDAWGAELGKGLPRDVDLKTVTHASGRAIDRILMNAGAAEEFVPETRFVYATATRPEGYDYRTTPPPRGYASDHFPVVVEFVVGGGGE